MNSCDCGRAVGVIISSAFKHEHEMQTIFDRMKESKTGAELSYLHGQIKKLDAELLRTVVQHVAETYERGKLDYKNQSRNGGAHD